MLPWPFETYQCRLAWPLEKCSPGLVYLLYISTHFSRLLLDFSIPLPLDVHLTSSVCLYRHVSEAHLTSSRGLLSFPEDHCTSLDTSPEDQLTSTAMSTEAPFSSIPLPSLWGPSGSIDLPEKSPDFRLTSPCLPNFAWPLQTYLWRFAWISPGMSPVARLNCPFLSTMASFTSSNIYPKARLIYLGISPVARLTYYLFFLTMVFLTSHTCVGGSLNHSLPRYVFQGLPDFFSHACRELVDLFIHVPRSSLDLSRLISRGSHNLFKMSLKAPLTSWVMFTEDCLISPGMTPEGLLTCLLMLA